ncbi:hypothetical protein E4U41_001101 [Claviceps citrina]|nr:hypothetical protein E4U41_001101 [Claviceps citrina]
MASNAAPAPGPGPAPGAACARSSSSSSSSSSRTTTTRVKRLPVRTKLPEEAAANPHHVILSKDGTLAGFRNPYPSAANPPSLGSMLRNVVWPYLTGQLRRPDTTSAAAAAAVPVRTPEFLPGRTSSRGGRLRATWLGHACYYVEFPSGLRVLFDPVFEDRCSPVGFAGPKRYTRRPCRLQDIPVVDAVVISHSHYDHLSHRSVVEMQRHHPGVHFFVGLGLGCWFRGSGLDNVTELDWWEDADLTVSLSGVVDKLTGERQDDHDPDISARISALPCQHTSARTPWDKDKTLWCSWAVRSGDKSVWFGGDTGYRAVPPGLPAAAADNHSSAAHASLPHCPQFSQIGHLRGPFDLGLIPIGAYHPRAAWSAVHADPFDAVDIFVDTGCERAMAIHWGTWPLTMEEILEPPMLLREALRRKGIAEEGVFDE